MLAQFSVFPFGKGASLSRQVAEAVREVDRSGLRYRVTDMGTILEGDWDAVTDLLKRVHDRLLKDADRVYLTVSFDSRKDKDARLDSKVRSVEALLGKKAER
jgi:uncharacterized protein (TIGR00106 family)